MRRGRIFIYLAFILILGLVAVVVVWQRFLTPQQPSQAAAVPTKTVDTVNVIVVTQKLSRGTPIQEQVLGMIPIQRELFIQGMYTNMADVKGRLAKFDLDAGIPITSGMLVESAEQLSTTGSVAALSIPRGMVSVSIPIDRFSSVSYAPQPGDHVNVIVTMLMADYDQDFQTILPNQPGLVLGPGPLNPEQGPSAITAYYKDGAKSSTGKGVVDVVLGQTFYETPSESQRPRMVSQSLVQDAVVLHVGDFALPEGTTGTSQPENIQPVGGGSEPVSQTTGGEKAQPQENTQDDNEQLEATPTPVPVQPGSMSLIVSPQDAITLNYLMYSGARLTLALRSAGDDSTVQTNAVTLQYLLDQYNIPVPAKLPYGIPNRPDKGDDYLQLYIPPAEPTPTPVPEK